MGCRLTQNITKENCAYDVAGLVALYLINYTRGIKYTEEGGKITAIEVEAGAEALQAFKIDFLKNSASYSDELAEGGNGAKYRTHTLNFAIGGLAYDKLNEGDALSLGKFIAVAVDKNGEAVMLGRGNGLDASSFNYESGASDADAKGWTVVMASTEAEIARPIDESVIKAILHKDIDIVG